MEAGICLRKIAGELDFVFLFFLQLIARYISHFFHCNYVGLTRTESCVPLPYALLSLLSPTAESRGIRYPVKLWDMNQGRSIKEQDTSTMLP